MHSTKIIIKKEFPLCTFSNLRYLWREMTSAPSKNGTFFKYRSHKTTVVFYINSLIWLSLQSQEILNRPVFVLEILKSVWKFWKVSENSENYWKFWKDSEQILNIAEHSEQILNRFWKFWKLLKILNRFWTLLKILNRFWTISFFLNQYVLLHFH